MSRAGFVLSHVVQQHFDELANGCLRRRVAVFAPLPLWALTRTDLRMAAHLDGLVVAGSAARDVCERGLDAPASDVVFAATLWTIVSDRGLVDRLLSIVGAEDRARPGFVAALAWTDGRHLQGVITPLLRSSNDVYRALGIAACAEHGVDPGLESRGLLHDAGELPRARALRAAGELGFLSLLPACHQSLEDQDLQCRVWAAWSAVLLGDRHRALDTLVESALAAGATGRWALTLALQAMNSANAHQVLEGNITQHTVRRLALAATGAIGDPCYVPWLIHEMNSPLASAAGEAFALITGVDLDKQQLWANRPSTVESGPNDNPDDPNVDMDPDDGLPWPDVKKVEAWWQANAGRFQKGMRYFMGQPVTKEHCIHVLKTGYQRQRILAAQYLCLLEPGTPLFNTAAPAWRQQRLLAAM